MKFWEQVINNLPNAYKELFYTDFNSFRICNSCNEEYPEHNIFFRPNIHKGVVKYYTCRNCMEKGKLNKYLNNGISLKSLRTFFKHLLDGLKFCKGCDKFYEDTVENFLYDDMCLCRNCQGIKRLESNYHENAKLKTKNLKKCKYCKEIKDIESFSIHSATKGNRVSYCYDCEETYKLEKRQYDEKYYEDNKDDKLVYYHSWKENGGNLLRQINEESRRTKKKNLLSDLSKEDWYKILNRFDYSCAYCGLSENEHKEIYKQNLHQDHIIPLSKDGVYSNFNIIPACFTCNDKKKAMDLEDFLNHSKKFTLEKYCKIIDYLLEVV